jgi:hypothetical protein
MTQFLVSLLPFAVLVFVWVVLVGRLQKRQTSASRVDQLEPQAEGLEPVSSVCHGELRKLRRRSSPRVGGHSVPPAA